MNTIPAVVTVHGGVWTSADQNSTDGVSITQKTYWWGVSLVETSTRRETVLEPALFVSVCCEILASLNLSPGLPEPKAMPE